MLVNGIPPLKGAREMFFLGFIFMRLISILLFFSIVSFKNYADENSLIGFYKSCDRDGTFREFQITDNRTIIVSNKSVPIRFFKTKIKETSLIISQSIYNSIQLAYPDTLVVIEQSNTKVILKG
jgi:hypothetical protein